MTYWAPPNAASPCVGVEFFGYAAPGELAQAGAAAVVHTAAELETYILTH